MVTYKQLEALHWICRLGGFQQAAKRLNTSQAAISKRIQELESTFGTVLFDRSRREARLTPKAKELLPMVEAMLRLRDQFEDNISQPEATARNLRLGVTELTALTWLPALVAQIQARYPRITIEPDVDLSASLRDKLAKDKVDVIVLPDAFEHPGCITTPLASVENAWFCRRDLISNRRTLPLEKLASFPMLTQSSQSGSGVLLGRWLDTHGIHATQSVTSNSLLALVGLTISGLGVASMPFHCVQGLFGSKFLSVIKTDPALPAVPYVAVYRADAVNRLIRDVITIAQQSCDFRQVIKGGMAAP